MKRSARESTKSLQKGFLEATTGIEPVEPSAGEYRDLQGITQIVTHPTVRSDAPADLPTVEPGQQPGLREETPMRTNVDDTPFEGISRSVTIINGKRPWPTCRHCGSVLTGSRHEKTTTRRAAGMRHVIDVFRCGCGRGREVRRAA